MKLFVALTLVLSLMLTPVAAFAQCSPHGPCTEEMIGDSWVIPGSSIVCFDVLTVVYVDGVLISQTSTRRCTGD